MERSTEDIEQGITEAKAALASDAETAAYLLSVPAEDVRRVAGES